ncbi:unnamed protein product [Musa hybrid cultivar]
MSYGDTMPLHPSSQSDIDEIENLINAGTHTATVLPARPPSPSRASIPVSHSPFTLPPYQKVRPSSSPTPVVPSVPAAAATSPGGSPRIGISTGALGSPPDTLTEPVWDTVKRDLTRIVSNLKLVV